MAICLIDESWSAVSENHKSVSSDCIGLRPGGSRKAAFCKLLPLLPVIAKVVLSLDDSRIAIENLPAVSSLGFVTAGNGMKMGARLGSLRITCLTDDRSVVFRENHTDVSL